MSFPLAQTVQKRVYQAGATDAHGNTVDSWSVGVDTLVYGWGPSAADSEQGLPGREVVIRDVDIYAPPSVTSSPKDRWVLGGAEFEALGYAEDFNRGPFGFTPGVRISVQRVEG